jgi:hypothetical protein
MEAFHKTRGTEKSLRQRNVELRNTMRSLKVGAAYIHVTALLLGDVILLCITGP